MVNAGNAVDLVLEELMQHLEKGDIVLDGGNSHYLDTEQRITTLIAVPSIMRYYRLQ